MDNEDDKTEVEKDRDRHEILFGFHGHGVKCMTAF